MLYNEVVAFESVEEILLWDHWNESCWAVHSFGAIYYVVQGGWLWGWNTMYWNVTIQMKAAEQNFHMVLFITLYKVLVTLGMK